MKYAQNKKKLVFILPPNEKGKKITATVATLDGSCCNCNLTAEFLFVDTILILNCQRHSIWQIHQKDKHRIIAIVLIKVLCT